MVKSITLIGSGKVASHLLPKLKETNLQLNGLVCRNLQSSSLENIPLSRDAVFDFNHIPISDLYLLLVSDDAIFEVANKIPDSKGIIAHCSGATPLSVLKDLPNPTGVLYPMQTFASGVPVNWSDVSCFVEGDSTLTQKALFDFAKHLSPKVYALNSEQRIQLHLAAVFANNFVNQMFYEAFDICEKNKIPFEPLKSLIKKTANQILELSPKEAQTGPAKRNDQKAIQTHLDHLADVNQRKIYELITQRIINIHEEKL